MAIIIGDGGANVLTGTPDSDTIRGGGGADTLYGLAGADMLYGEAGNDTLDGGDGNDLLDGGSSADTMRGGAGNDVYSVNAVGDRVEETLAGAPGGTDTVFASIAFTLGANFENLHLVVEAGGGTGNALANVITGNVGAESLYGLGGDDTLFGKEGNDVLDGNRGADRMEGGEGDDSYYVENAGDRAIETVGGVRGGADTVFSAVDFTLGANLENLTLYGAASVGQGNGWANRIVGNAGPDRLVGWGGDDILDGGPGRDELNGGTGNDTAVFRTAPMSEDYPFELDGEPRAIVNLATGVAEWEASGEADRLISIESIITGDGHDTIAGSAGNNVINPGRGANVVDAGAGDDVIEGGSWAGSYASTEVLRGGAGNDVIYGNGNAIQHNELIVRSDVMDGGAGNDRLVADVRTGSASPYDANMMTGGTGADRFMFNDERLTLGHIFTVDFGTEGTVTDFDPGEGDRLIFDLDSPSSADFVGETADIGVGEYGFFRSGADAIVQYGIAMGHDDELGTDYLVAISVRLAEYAAPVTAGDVLLV